MTDQELMIDALEEAQRILAYHIAPRAPPAGVHGQRAFASA
jgi:hypothetical protein